MHNMRHASSAILYDLPCNTQHVLREICILRVTENMIFQHMSYFFRLENIHSLKRYQ